MLRAALSVRPAWPVTLPHLQPRATTLCRGAAVRFSHGQAESCYVLRVYTMPVAHHKEGLVQNILCIGCLKRRAKARAAHG